MKNNSCIQDIAALMYRLAKLFFFYFTKELSVATDSRSPSWYVSTAVTGSVGRYDNHFLAER